MASEYLALVVRGWTKEKLATRIEQHLSGIDSEDIISINYYVEPVIMPFWRRNSALITLRSQREDQ